MNINRLMTAVGAAACVSMPLLAQADVVVGEDFLYQQPSRTDTSFGDIRFGNANYGGGRNGSVGTWEERWTGLGSGSIISDDVVAEPFASNPFTARANGQNGVNSNIQRDYSFSDTLADDQTLYFGGRFLVSAPGPGQPRFIELGILTAPTLVGEAGNQTVASIGVEDGTFFAHAGARDLPAVSATTFGDPLSDAADAVADDTYVTIVGKLEFNVAPSVLADFNADGVTDAADYTVWRDNTGIDDGTATFEQGDATGDGNVNGDDRAVWAQTYRGFTDRVTAYINPTGTETSAGSVLVAESFVSHGLFSDEAESNLWISGGYNDAGTFDSSDAFVDDVVIATTFDEVLSLVVPRLDAVVDTTTGDVTLTNNTGEDFELAYYEIVSESGSLETTYNSLDDQGADGDSWLENSPTESLLTESNLLGGATLTGDGASVTLAGAFDTMGDQDLIVRWGLIEGGDGLLNLANVSYIASPAAIPEPTSLAAVVALCGGAVLACRRG